MNKTITIYELLGLVKDGKELPKLENEVEKDFTYYVYDQWGETCNLKDLKKVLNDTVEIIENNDKLEKMQDFDLTLKETNVTKDLELTYEGVSKTFNYAWHKIDEIIDHINKIEEKLDEK